MTKIKTNSKTIIYPIQILSNFQCQIQFSMGKGGGVFQQVIVIHSATRGLKESIEIVTTSLSEVMVL